MLAASSEQEDGVLLRNKNAPARGVLVEDNKKHESVMTIRRRRLGSYDGNTSPDVVTARHRTASRKKNRSLKKEEKSSKSSSAQKSTKKSKLTKAPKCDPEKVNLFDYPQWRAEQGYWIGEYTFLKGDGSPFVSGNWNYPYDNYKGFITGNISG
jgi:DNA-directed RNA polymerase subunit M/transcription elongation factor TFIIS